MRAISFGHTNRINYNAPVILGFSAICFFVMIFNNFTGGWLNHEFFMVYRSSPTTIGFWIRLFGHSLGHIDWAHFSGNILAILMIGPALEERCGSLPLFLMMFATAVIIGVLNLTFFSTSLLGASGVVFMVMVLSAIVSYQQRSLPMTLILVAVVYIGKEIVTGILVEDNISQFSHVVGGIVGAIFGLFLIKHQDHWY